MASVSFGAGNPKWTPTPQNIEPLPFEKVLCFQPVRPIWFCAGFQSSLMMKSFRINELRTVSKGKVLVKRKRGEGEGGRRTWGVGRADLMGLLWIGFLVGELLELSLMGVLWLLLMGLLLELILLGLEVESIFFFRGSCWGDVFGQGSFSVSFSTLSSSFQIVGCFHRCFDRGVLCWDL